MFLKTNVNLLISSLKIESIYLRSEHFKHKGFITEKYTVWIENWGKLEDTFPKNLSNKAVILSSFIK